VQPIVALAAFIGCTLVALHATNKGHLQATFRAATNTANALYHMQHGGIGMLSATQKSAWEKVEKKHCKGTNLPTAYASMQAAKTACLELKNQCSGVYDSGCNDAGNFYCCTSPAQWADSVRA
jgi:hypothetical protein